MQSSYSATQRWSSANAALEQRNAVLSHHRNIAANEPSIRQTQPVPGHGPRTLGVIVYLAQARHSSYGRDSLKLLRRSVDALVENYLAEHNDDVIFLHYGEVPRDRQDELIAVCGSSVHARFLTLNSSFTTPPPGTPPQSKWMHRNRFSPGYRHMIRLFAIGLWPLIAEQGYEYVMRMDEDSFILSRVRYNFFEFMRSTGIDYAYRLASWEAVPGKGHPEPFHHFVRGFLRSRPNLSPTWLLDSCIDKSVRNYTTANCGNMYGFYNNFFVSRVGFWMRSDVQEFLRYADHSHNIYLRRWNDILWQSAAVQMYLPHRRVRMLRDFAYEHATFFKAGYYNSSKRIDSPSSGAGVAATELATKTVSRCVLFGGITLGTSENQSAARARLRTMLSMPLCRERTFTHSVIRPCAVPSYDSASDLPHAFLMGSVSDQEAHCSAPSPRPFYCALGTHSRGNYNAGEVYRKDSECLCRPSEKTRTSVFGRCYCAQLKRMGVALHETTCPSSNAKRVQTSNARQLSMHAQFIRPHRSTEALLAAAEEDRSSALVNCSSARRIVIEGTAGFMSHVVRLLNALSFCERTGCAVEPIWRKYSCYTDGNRVNDSAYSAFDDYFEPLCPRRVPDDTTHRPVPKAMSRVQYRKWYTGTLEQPPHAVFLYYYGAFGDKVQDSYDSGWYEAMRSQGNRLVARYLRPLPDIVAGAAREWQDMMLSASLRATSRRPPVLGLQLRGTDVLSEKSLVRRRANMSWVQALAQAYVDAHPGARVFLATDDLDLLAQVQQWPCCSGRLKYRTNVARGGSWRDGCKHRGTVGHLMGRDALIDAMLLARCDFLLHSASGVAEFAHHFNPKLHEHSVNIGYDRGHESNWLVQLAARAMP